MGNGMQGTQEMGKAIFRGMLPSIPGNVLQHSRECHQTFREMLVNILGMLPNIPRNVLKHSRECWQCYQTFQAMSPTILGNALKGMSPNIPGNVANFLCK